MLVHVTRGDRVESEHRVAACARDAGGAELLHVGDVEMPVYVRSTAKPFIAAAVVAGGAVERLGLEQYEIAVIAGSHAAEPFHLDAVRSILKKAEVPESALQCGAHAPNDERAALELARRGQMPTAIHNNCSGKHAGILALCKMLRADTDTYLKPEHPAERAILALCGRLFDDDLGSWALAIDGCGIPTFATPLRNTALAFARLASLEGVSDEDAGALCAVRAAMTACPEYVAGTGQFDTELMRAVPGRFVAKGGAEGVHGVALLQRGIGYASKVIDGAGRARGPTTIAALRSLQALDEGDESLARLEHPVVYNRAGMPVGEIRVV